MKKKLSLIINKSKSFSKQAKCTYLFKNLICKQYANLALFAALLHCHKTSQWQFRVKKNYSIYNTNFDIRLKR